MLFLNTETAFLSVLPANKDLAGAEVELVRWSPREFRLRRALAAIDDTYRFIIIVVRRRLALLPSMLLTAAKSLLVAYSV